MNGIRWTPWGVLAAQHRLVVLVILLLLLVLLVVMLVVLVVVVGCGQQGRQGWDPGCRGGRCQAQR
jgi:hypothetical protein